MLDDNNCYVQYTLLLQVRTKIVKLSVFNFVKLHVQMITLLAMT